MVIINQHGYITKKLIPIQQAVNSSLLHISIEFVFFGRREYAEFLKDKIISIHLVVSVLFN